jgi:hypothetical protein
MAIEAKNVVLPCSAQHLEAICRVLADTDTGLTGYEIGYLLQDSRIVDTPTQCLHAMVKLDRNYAAQLMTI